MSKHRRTRRVYGKNDPPPPFPNNPMSWLLVAGVMAILGTLIGLCAETAPDLPPNAPPGYHAHY